MALGRRLALAIVGCAMLLTTNLLSPSLAGIPGIPGVPIPIPPVPKVPKLPSLPIPDVTVLVAGEDTITTSVADAISGIPFLNDYEPLDARFLGVASRVSGGAFEVPAGSYIFEGRSYCLHPGKHTIAGGSGYLLAPLKGSRAKIIQTILVKSADQVDIPQPRVQQLIWAVQARSRISDLSPQLQADAVKLLTPAQILRLDQGAIGFAPEDKLGALLAQVPDPLKPVVQAENSLRGLLASNATYNEMERVAVLPDVTQMPGTVQPIRWSFDPRGFFVSYTSHGYQATTTFLDVPGVVFMRQDALGRVSLLQDRSGDEVSFSYGSKHSDAPTISGDPQTHFYRLRSVRFVWSELINRKSTTRTETWSTNEWVMTGIPNGQGHVGAVAGLTDGQQVYGAADVLRNQFAGVLRAVHGQPSVLAGLMALAEMRAALKSAAEGRTITSAAVMSELNFPFAAWESVFASSVGGHIAAHVRAGIDDPFDPSNNVATPQSPVAQRLGQSPSPNNCDWPPGSGNNTQQQIAKGLNDGGFPGAGSSPQGIGYTYSNNVMHWGVDLNGAGNAINSCGNRDVPYSIEGFTYPSPNGTTYTSINVYHNGKQTGHSNGTSPNGCIPCSIANALQNLPHFTVKAP